MKLIDVNIISFFFRSRITARFLLVTQRARADHKNSLKRDITHGEASARADGKCIGNAESVEA